MSKGGTKNAEDMAEHEKQRDVYDRLLAWGVKEPAVLSFPSVDSSPPLLVAGRWETVGELKEPDVATVGGEVRPSRYTPSLPLPPVVCRVGKVGVCVLGEGTTWEEVLGKVSRKLNVYGEKWSTRVKQDAKAPPTAEKAVTSPKTP